MRPLLFADLYLRYLEDDDTTVVLERRGRLKGYELYLVEQWACSRIHPTFVITTYTGDQSHSVLVGVLGVPGDEETWSPRLRVYYHTISKFHARPKETPLGILMVTNLSGFPSALTVIPVPDGDIKKHREDFIVNEDLKRLGCSGRSGLSIGAPAAATQAKFHQLYKTSDRIDLFSAVIELVKLCQVALMMFGKLEQEYADGLLCDVTERAINDWWSDIGSEHYNLEPSDGILGPTTVAALLGLLMGARNRLNYCGAPVAKDAFDIASLKRGIAYFQKSQKMKETRRLDRLTLTALHRVTAKAAAGEGWGVPKAVKSTVVELGGKGGEMVMGMVGGGKDKAGIGDIETLDIDRFVSLVHGERSKWLWYGKVRRSGTLDSFGKSLPEMGNVIYTKDDHGGYVWSRGRTPSMPVYVDPEPAKKEGSSSYSIRHPESLLSVAESPGEHRRTVFKSVTGKMSDARSGFGRIKDAVGLRGHISRSSKDEAVDTEGHMGGYFTQHSSTLSPSPMTGIGPGNFGKSFTWKNKPEEYQDGYRKDRDQRLVVTSPNNLRDSHSPSSGVRTSLPPQEEIALKDPEAAAKWSAQVKEIRRGLVINEPSVAGSVYGGGDLEGPLLGAERDPNNTLALLVRRHSFSEASRPRRILRDEAWWPRHMSFSYAEDAVLTWDDIGILNEDDQNVDNWTALQSQKLLASDLKQLHFQISNVKDGIGHWVKKKVASVEELDNQASRDQAEFRDLYYQLSDNYQVMQQNTQDILAEERSHVTEAVKDIEVLGAKLEYEINALRSKVEEVEDGVVQFESEVNDLESRARILEQQLKKESWLHWALRSVTGIGTRPPD